MVLPRMLFEYFCFILFLHILGISAAAPNPNAIPIPVNSVATTTRPPSSTPAPVCLQPRTSTEPTVSALQSSLASDDSINKACDPKTQKIGDRPFKHVYYAGDAYYFLNSSLENLPIISSPTATPTSFPGNRICIDSLNAIFSSCVTPQKFLGGWMEVVGVNYSSEWPLLRVACSKACSN